MRRRKKADEEIQKPAAATAATANANTAPAAAMPAGEYETSLPKPSLSQRLVQSLKQNLGGSEKAHEVGCL